MTPARLAFLLLAAPLASAAFTACFLRRRGRAAAALSVGVAALILAGALWLGFSGERFEASREWLSLGGLIVSFGFKFDDLAALMLVIVALVGFCVHVFSLGYMSGDSAKGRYFAGLSIFMFSMTGIVLADNLFMMFIFWEFVGFSSWLLINHWHERPAPCAAAKKAFITNRVGDFGFLLGIIMCYWIRGTVNLTDLAVQSSSGFAIYSRAIPLLLFCGAIGKSAQLPLQVWLPDAMEGPTPVSALIHAATMVAAGIYMLCRIQMLMVPQALTGDRLGRHGHRPLRGPVRGHPARHQEGPRLFHALPARLHGCGVRARLGRAPAGGRRDDPRRGRSWRRDVPPDDARLFQGAALPRLGLGDPRVPP